MKTLDSMHVGQSAFVKRVYGEGSVKRRLMDMGLTKGTTVFIKNVAPFGDPMEIVIRGYKLTLRKADAIGVEVEE